MTVDTRIQDLPQIGTIATNDKLVGERVPGSSSLITYSNPVAAGTLNQLAYYSVAGSNVSGLATANNGVLITSGTGLPSISSTLPSGMAATNMTLTTPTFIAPALGAASATSLAFTSTSGIIGTTTNNSAAAGSVGETLSGNGTVSLTSAVALHSCSVSLTAGDWNIYGNVTLTPTGSPIVTLAATSIGTVADTVTLPSSLATSGITYLNITQNVGTLCIFSVGPTVLSLASTTTIYLNTLANFSGGTLGTSGIIYARRVR